MIKILLASTSQHKLSAVQKAFEKIYPQEKIKIKTVKAASNINEQPVGYSEIFQGAANRIKNAKSATQKESLDFIVGIENGIIPVKTAQGKRWFDVAGVIIENKEGQQSLALSAGVEFPSDLVEKARKMGFTTTTVGSLIAKEAGGDATDPHHLLTKGLVTRSFLLEEAIKIALGQL